MAKKKTAPPKKSKWQRFKRNAVTTLIILIILYIGGHVISRLEGTRQAIVDKLSNGTRQPISIQKTGMTLLCGLHLQGLSFQGVEMPDVKMKFNWLFFFSKETPFVRELSIRNMEMTFRQVPNTGNWEPLILSGIGRRLGAVVGFRPPDKADDSLPKFPPKAINAKTLLQLEDAKVVWKDANGREVAYITDANLRFETGSFIKRKVIQTIFKCEHLKLANGRGLRKFRLEAFRVDGSPWVTVMDMADINGQYEEFATDTLWQDLNEQLNLLSSMH
ncbi:hypothetical protein [Pontiella agarivorans]|uniref:Uncharacterized protein n=1 Tax=Pontiella agarivorans TaxID=3038953 RepID=A0ABU5MW74_9BACT|nr:hypothetical protein [Pontiella agarivorans]MDZ8118476.1 hypothetical protein [Pontiella agarivorans]